jgi:hypothetical protein
MAANLRALTQKLNDTPGNALQGAAGLCVSRAQPSAFAEGSRPSDIHVGATEDGSFSYQAAEKNLPASTPVGSWLCTCLQTRERVSEPRASASGCWRFAAACYSGLEPAAAGQHA